MQYITITFNQRDASTLSSIFATLPQYFKEVQTKKYLWTIQGLVSRSFEYPNVIPANMVQSLFNSKCCPISYTVLFVFISSIHLDLRVWVKYGFKSVQQSEVHLNTIDQYGNLAGISFGFLTSNVSYAWSEEVLDYYYCLQWKPNTRQKYLAIRYQTNELRLNQDCLMKYFIISTAYPGFYMIILPLKAIPRCFLMSPNPGCSPQRTFSFGIFSAACLTDSSALCLQFYDHNSLSACTQFLISVMNLDCHNGPIRYDQISPQTWHCDHILAAFWSTYAYQMLLALGYRIKRQITPTTFQKIENLSLSSQSESYSNNPCYLKLIALYYQARHNHFFDINEEFDGIQPMPSSVILDIWFYVPRIYLTPYGVYPLPVKPIRGNRILRERQLFGPADHFCRVIIRDIDLGQPQQDFMKINEQWIKNLLVGVDSITVGDRQFHFLLSSNSQLRDRSFWFHASYENRGADYIRQWMGDFSHEKCVGTRIARMALSLTGTTPTITVMEITIFLNS